MLCEDEVFEEDEEEGKEDSEETSEEEGSALWLAEEGTEEELAPLLQLARLIKATTLRKN